MGDGKKANNQLKSLRTCPWRFFHLNSILEYEH
jgi:hypothetical protein